MGNRNVDYAFSNSAPQADQHLSSLEEYLDPMTVACLRELVPAGSGSRCLELGPGRGSIARWLIHRVGPAGRVVAVDRDPRRLAPAGNLEIVRHDLQRGLPVTGPFALIHARLVLLHLPNRDSLLQRLVAELAPGGWLVIGEFRSAKPPAVLTPDIGRDTALFTRVVDETLGLLGAHYGLDNLWGERVHEAMARAGLRPVTVAVHDGVWTGGGPGCGLFSACASQKHEQLLARGLTEGELQRFQALMRDPQFGTRAWSFACVRGQRPG